jgi:hypothetical protein
MALFSTPYDIANRGIQKVGGRRMGVLGFAEVSKNAQEAAFVYDKLRTAELRRNVWRFATRKTAIRPIVSTSGLVTPLTWAVGTTYAAGQIVADPVVPGFYWQSVQGSNTGNVPGADNGLFWVSYFGTLISTVYAAGTVFVRGDICNAGSTVSYVSLANANTGNAPASGAPWLSLGAATNGTINLFGPMELSNDGTAAARNIYQLPTGFLRLAQQDPKSANAPVLGTSGGIQFNDWEFNGNFFVSAQTKGLQIMRFVADVTDVPSMDPTFCEGLACRVGLELVETLTQSGEKKKAITSEYEAFIATARLINAIEIGTTEPLEDDYLGGRTLEESGTGGPQRAQQ